MSTTLTVKGQVTIPKNIRDHLGLKPGDQLDFDFADDGSVRMRPARSRPKRVKDVFGPLVGVWGRNGNTDAWMDMLRGYSDDKDDPGFQ